MIIIIVICDETSKMILLWGCGKETQQHGEIHSAVDLGELRHTLSTDYWSIDR